MREEVWGGLDCVVTGGTDGDGGGDGPIVVLLHGYGAPGDDLVPLAGAFRAPRSVRFVFPAAPIDLGWGRAWWLIDMERLQRDMAAGKPRELSEKAPEGLDEARAHVDALLDELAAGPGAGGAPIVLGGFSQGAMLSCDVALRSDPARRPLAGLVLMSGMFLTPAVWTARMAGRAGLPVVMSHGTMDDLLPFAHATRLRDALRAAGLDVDWYEFAGGHGIPPTVIEGVARLLGAVAKPRLAPVP